MSDDELYHDTHDDSREIDARLDVWLESDDMIEAVTQRVEVARDAEAEAATDPAERLALLKVAVPGLINGVRSYHAYSAVDGEGQHLLVFEVGLANSAIERLAERIFGESQHIHDVNVGTVVGGGLTYLLPKSVCNLCQSLNAQEDDCLIGKCPATTDSGTGRRTP